MSNDFETHARRAKANDLVAWCNKMGFGADDVIAMTDPIRRQACIDANVNLASPETWAVVVGLLGARAAQDRMPAAMRAALPDDPFEGLS